MINKLFYDEIDSTNTELKRLIEKENLPEFTVVIAEKQTLGKGQNNNSWISEEGGLYFSFILKPEKNINLISLITGLSVKQSIEKYSDKKIEIKWPNDILLNNKKISGILTEGRFNGNKVEFIIVGCGININQKNFPYLAENTPTSLYLENNQILDKNQILDEFFNNFKNNYRKLQENINVIEIINEINNNLYLKNELITINLSNNDFVEGKLLSLNEDGSLSIKKADEKISNIYSGRISKKNL
jgi:BirA family biotin operon repressor/biotin-[acetyl-CoA-carboxylase] ligase